MLYHLFYAMSSICNSKLFLRIFTKDFLRQNAVATKKRSKLSRTFFEGKGYLKDGKVVVEKNPLR